jgi:hypothetical protein
MAQCTATARVAAPLLMLLLLLCLAGLRGAHAIVKASGQLTSCVRDGSLEPNLNSIQCQRKLLINAAAISGQQQSEFMHITTARQADGSEVPLGDEFLIFLYKEQPQA